MQNLKESKDKNIIFAHQKLNKIPYLVSYKNDNNAKPLIFLSHGFTESKDVFKDEISELTKEGYFVIALDNRLHGMRKGPGFKEVAYNEGRLDIYQVRKAIKGTADDIVTLIDYYITDKQVDPDRIAIMGTSMGGCIAFRTLVIEKRIKVALPIIGTPYWEDIPGDPDIDNATDVLNRVDKFAKEYNPANNPGKFFPSSVLIQITENDPHVNAKKVEQFYEILKPYYQSAPENLNLIVYPGLKHKYTAEMWRAALDWIRKYL